MSIMAARTFVRRFTRPLLLFWLFSQSMLLCAAGMGDHGLDTSASMDQTVAADHSMHANHAEMAPRILSADAAVTHEHADSAATAGAAGAHDCCESQDAATPASVFNLLLLLLVLLLLAPLSWLLPMLSGAIRYLAYWREPSLRYNYPAYPILHCSLLH
ncbi:MAG: hypothetical protein H7A01_12280 [Hahellaceae bacterium]|nr:hypothetical protein [Hahellaceae bacterium]MCP5209904.1 hypothetical protein [Hahellaceae bacterium]